MLGTPLKLDGVLDYNMPTFVTSMLSVEDSQVPSCRNVKTNNYRLHYRYLCLSLFLTAEHAKVLLPYIIPKKKLPKIQLLLIFFGANDATLEGCVQHVSPCLAYINIRSP